MSLYNYSTWTHNSRSFANTYIIWLDPVGMFYYRVIVYPQGDLAAFVCLFDRFRNLENTIHCLSLGCPWIALTEILKITWQIQGNRIKPRTSAWSRHTYPVVPGVPEAMVAVLVGIWIGARPVPTLDTNVTSYWACIPWWPLTPSAVHCKFCVKKSTFQSMMKATISLFVICL